MCRDNDMQQPVGGLYPHDNLPHFEQFKNPSLNLDQQLTDLANKPNIGMTDHSTSAQ